MFVGSFRNNNLIKQNLSRSLDEAFDIEEKKFAKIWNDIHIYLKTWVPLQDDKIWVMNIEKKWKDANKRCKEEFINGTF